MRGPDRTIQFPLPFGERVRVRGSGRTIQFPLPFGERVRVRGSGRTIQFPFPFGERVRGSGRTESYIAPGGIDSLRSPLLGPSLGLAPSGPTQALFKNAPGVFVRAACSLRSQSVQLAAPVVDPSVGGSHPSLSGEYAKKKPVFSYELFLKYGGEGGIRTLDTLPYTHFPGVLLQPLGHLTILSSRCWRDGR